MSQAWADDQEFDHAPAAWLPTLTVIGSKEAIFDIPGSGFYVETLDIREQSYDDINRVLRKVPGVYLREEDGFGLFPNISLRGVDTTRSAKVTLMEDGILIAPAPYSDSAAYFSPSVGRMHAIEVLKGSSQIRYGPHTTGGVINYLSTPVPYAPTGYVKVLFGENGEVRTHAYYGQTLDLGQDGLFGYLIEVYHRRSDGFKQIDTVGGFTDSDDTGFTNLEPMLKLTWEPKSDLYQQFMLKIGYTDRDAKESYLGLAEEDINRVGRRYAASRFDRFDSWQTRIFLRHHIEFNDNLTLTHAVYYNRFHRNWYRLDGLQNIDTNGDGVGDGFNQGLSPALAQASGGVGLDVLKGTRVGDLRVRANDRDYYSYGYQAELTYDFIAAEISHKLDVGLRYHTDRVRRFQRDDTFEQQANGTIADNDGDGVAFIRGIDGDAGDRREETQAWAFFIEDKAKLTDRLTVNAGVRVEWLRLRHSDSQDATTNGVDNLVLIGGGGGFTYDMTDEWTVFGGVHSGFSPPNPRAAVRGGLEEETSISFESGLRYKNARKSFTAEATGFFTRFNDLIVIDNVGGGGIGESENVGKVDSTGVELSLQYDPGVAYNWGVSVPSFISFTFTDAVLRGSAGSSNPNSIFAGGKDGHRVPYIPQFQLAVGTGLDTGQWGVFLTASFVDEVFTTANNTTNQVDGAGNPDARFGQLDSHIVVDLSAYHLISSNAKIIAGVNNLFNEKYIASRHPHGPRHGQPRFGYVGVEIKY